MSRFRGKNQGFGFECVKFERQEKGIKYPSGNGEKVAGCIRSGIHGSSLIWRYKFGSHQSCYVKIHESGCSQSKYRVVIPGLYINVTVYPGAFYVIWEVPFA